MLTRLTSRYWKKSGFARDEQDFAAPVPRLRPRTAQATRGFEVSFYILRGTAWLECQNLEAKRVVKGVEFLRFQVDNVQSIWLTRPRSPKLRLHHQQGASCQ